MSTTVTYKGSTLATVENATKKLTTAGTWLEDDITIQDTSSGGGSVVVVDTPDSHGGTIREITAQNTVSLQAQKQVTLTTSPQTITPDTGYDGFASVVVDAGQIGTVTQDQDGYLVLSPNGGSGDKLNWTKRTINVTSNTPVVDRDFTDFMLIAQADASLFPTAAANKVPFFMIIYVNGKHLASGNKKGWTVNLANKSNGAAASSSNITYTNVGDTSITFSAYTDNNMMTGGNWSVVQIELPSTSPLYSFGDITVFT